MLFIIFISYSLMAIPFNSLVSDEKISTLATKIGRNLVVFSTLTLGYYRFFLNPSKELVVGTDLFGQYSFLVSLRGVVFSRLFRFLFLLLTSFHEAFSFVFCVLCIICIKVSMIFTSFIRFCSAIDLLSESNFFLIRKALMQGLLYYKFFIVDTSLLSCSFCLCMSVLLRMIVSDCILVSQSNSNVPVLHPISMELLSY